MFSSQVVVPWFFNSSSFSDYLLLIFSFLLCPIFLSAQGQGNGQGNNPNALWQGNGSDTVFTHRAVGIKTSTPNFDLEVLGSQHNSGLLLVDSNAHIKGNALIGNSILIDGQSDSIATSSDHLSFGNDTLTTKGNVGIGTRHPDKALHIFSQHFHTVLPASHQGVRLEYTVGGAVDTSRWDIEPQLGDHGEKLMIGPPGDTTVLTLNEKGQKVGIGTETPEKALHILTSHQVTQNLVPIRGSHQGIRLENRSISHGQVTDTSQWDIEPKTTQAGDVLQFGPPNNKVMTLTDTGKVGVGTTQPKAKLHVKGKGIFENTLHLKGAIKDDSGSTGQPKHVLTSTGSGINWSKTPSDGDWKTTDTTIYRKKDNVGVGTKFPGKKLEVKTVHKHVLTPSKTGGSNGTSVHYDFGEVPLSQDIIQAGGTDEIDIDDETSTLSHEGIRLQNVVKKAGLSLPPGQSWPTAVWDIEPVIDTTKNRKLYFRTPRRFIMGISDTGFIGIGTPVPKTPLSIFAPTANSPVGITQRHVGGPNTMELTTQDGNGKQATRILLRGSAENADVEFYRGNRGNEQLTMEIEGSSGNVGIGTTSPSHQLEVDGTAGMNKLAINTGNIPAGFHMSVDGKLWPRK